MRGASWMCYIITTAEFVACACWLFKDEVIYSEYTLGERYVCGTQGETIWLCI